MGRPVFYYLISNPRGTGHCRRTARSVRWIKRLRTPMRTSAKAGKSPGIRPQWRVAAHKSHGTRNIA